MDLLSLFLDGMTRMRIQTVQPYTVGDWKNVSTAWGGPDPQPTLGLCGGQDVQG